MSTRTFSEAKQKQDIGLFCKAINVNDFFKLSFIEEDIKNKMKSSPYIYIGTKAELALYSKNHSDFFNFVKQICNPAIIFRINKIIKDKDDELFCVKFSFNKESLSSDAQSNINTNIFFKEFKKLNGQLFDSDREGFTKYIDKNKSAQTLYLSNETGESGFINSICNLKELKNISQIGKYDDKYFFIVKEDTASKKVKVEPNDYKVIDVKYYSSFTFTEVKDRNSKFAFKDYSIVEITPDLKYFKVLIDNTNLVIIEKGKTNDGHYLVEWNFNCKNKKCGKWTDKKNQAELIKDNTLQETIGLKFDYFLEASYENYNFYHRMIAGSNKKPTFFSLYYPKNDFLSFRDHLLNEKFDVCYYGTLIDDDKKLHPYVISDKFIGSQKEFIEISKKLEEYDFEEILLDYSPMLDQKPENADTFNSAEDLCIALKRYDDVISIGKYLEDYTKYFLIRENKEIESILDKNVKIINYCFRDNTAIIKKANDSSNLESLGKQKVFNIDSTVYKIKGSETACVKMNFFAVKIQSNTKIPVTINKTFTKSADSLELLCSGEPVDFLPSILSISSPDYFAQNNVADLFQKKTLAIDPDITLKDLQLETILEEEKFLIGLIKKVIIRACSLFVDNKIPLMSEAFVVTSNDNYDVLIKYDEGEGKEKEKYANYRRLIEFIVLNYQKIFFKNPLLHISISENNKLLSSDKYKHHEEIKTELLKEGFGDDELKQYQIYESDYRAYSKQKKQYLAKYENSSPIYFDDLYQGYYNCVFLLEKIDSAESAVLQNIFGTHNNLTAFERYCISINLTEEEKIRKSWGESINKNSNSGIKDKLEQILKIAKIDKENFILAHKILGISPSVNFQNLNYVKTLEYKLPNLDKICKIISGDNNKMEILGQYMSDDAKYKQMNELNNYFENKKIKLSKDDELAEILHKSYEFLPLSPDYSFGNNIRLINLFNRICKKLFDDKHQEDIKMLQCEELVDKRDNIFREINSVSSKLQTIKVVLENFKKN
jgi:hypothetical protein